MTRKSCPEGMRNAILRNYLKFTAQIDLLLIQIESAEILSMVGARRVTIPESEAFRTRHEVPRVKKETRDETSTT